MTEEHRCIDCGKETFFRCKTGQYTSSFICLNCQKNYEQKEIIVHQTITILVKKEE